MESRVSDALVAIRRIVRAAEFASRDLARTTGLTPSQLIVLQIVAREGEPGAGAIAEAARLSQATVTALLDKLEARGLVIRNRGSQDRRRVSVELTQEGRRALADMPDVLQDRFAARFENLADWEQASIIAGLERVAALLNAEGIDASPVLDVGALD
ncbi:MAG: MarR family transcriptional regulator [Phenylobacterium sp.]|jgi:DNA-binding MarR family transcriptional regulator|uniref:MarR family winged helix-turn-helix transcriptional regulator n=1 Tax=Phenylobacterium sp. TaxID=1871053 RepID=UPI000BC3F2EF|nr:MarR family transcriptional regulator [Phenylobacterium sp.]MDO8900298.1 MarR family transcriptional regulator [Phenylobacterium sp.]MDP2215582.1 MarR family transcriptional regulator [Phenylobacterium sp.]OYW90098.1 MAG: MarR family transcriptional regulator [Caulobacterales bacterium 32-67-6]